MCAPALSRRFLYVHFIYHKTQQLGERVCECVYVYVCVCMCVCLCVCVCVRCWTYDLLSSCRKAQSAISQMKLQQFTATEQNSTRPICHHKHRNTHIHTHTHRVTCHVHISLSLTLYLSLPPYPPLSLSLPTPPIFLSPFSYPLLYPPQIHSGNAVGFPHHRTVLRKSAD